MLVCLQCFCVLIMGLVGLAVCLYCGVMHAWDFIWRAKFLFRLFICKTAVLFSASRYVGFPIQYTPTIHKFDTHEICRFAIYEMCSYFCPSYCIFLCLNFVFVFILCYHYLFYMHLSSVWHCITFILFSLIDCCL